MKTWLVNYGGDVFAKSSKRLRESALKYGVDEVVEFTRKDIVSSEFYARNKWILDQKRGAGLWLWKPYIILEALKKADDGDIVFYSDSGIEIISSLAPLVEICKKKSMILFRLENPNRSWIKRDCFALTRCDSEEYWNGTQVYGSFQVYKKNKENVAFTQEWLKFCENRDIISDLPGICGLPNFPEFVAHRHDQAVLTLMAIKHKVELFRDPCQYGDYYKLKEFRKEGELKKAKPCYFEKYSKNPMENSRYPTLLRHHRERTKDIGWYARSAWDLALQGRLYGKIKSKMGLKNNPSAHAGNLPLCTRQQ